MIYQNFLKLNHRYKIKGRNITSNHRKFSNSSIHNRRCIRIRIHFGTAICNLSRPSLQNFGAVCITSHIKYLIHKRMHKVEWETLISRMPIWKQLSNRLDTPYTFMRCLYFLNVIKKFRHVSRLFLNAKKAFYPR